MPQKETFVDKIISTDLDMYWNFNVDRNGLYQCLFKKGRNLIEAVAITPQKLQSEPHNLKRIVDALLKSNYGKNENNSSLGDIIKSTVAYNGVQKKELRYKGKQVLFVSVESAVTAEPSAQVKKINELTVCFAPPTKMGDLQIINVKSWVDWSKSFEYALEKSTPGLLNKLTLGITLGMNVTNLSQLIARSGRVVEKHAESLPTMLTL